MECNSLLQEQEIEQHTQSTNDIDNAMVIRASNSFSRHAEIEIIEMMSRDGLTMTLHGLQKRNIKFIDYPKTTRNKTLSLSVSL